MKVPKRILPIIVIAQFCCTSLWFATNGVMGSLLNNFGLDESALGSLTAAVQVGFILGTLLFALLTIADRFSPSRVFFICAALGAVSNLAILWDSNDLVSMMILRFITGFCLAGIYPVGMKIAADYFDKGLGKSLSFLVGALVLGTALPHLLGGFENTTPWKMVISITSVLAFLGGLIMLVFVPNGPFRKPSAKFNLLAFVSIFKPKQFRVAAFGYFGHMWELYAFWAFLPVMISVHNDLFPHQLLNVSFNSFLIIASGALACFIGGYLLQKFAVKRVAFFALLLSTCCCLLSPLFFVLESSVIFMLVLVFWGMVVVADSPLFSTMVAKNTTPVLKGTALTIVNCIGFALTIISILLLTYLLEIVDAQYCFLILAIGPLLGLIALARK